MRVNSDYFKSDTKRTILTQAGIDYIITQTQAGYSYTAIAGELGITPQAVSQAVKRENKSIQKNREPINKKKLSEYVEKGYSGPTIAQRMDYPVGTVYSAIHYMGLSIKRTSRMDDILFSR